MQASDLQIELPMVTRENSVAEATRIIADTGRLGVVVCDQKNKPIGMITAFDVLRLTLPDYLLADPSLAAVLDEQGVGEIIGRLRDRTVGDMIDDASVQMRKAPTVDPTDTVLEVAAELASSRSMIAVVAGDQPRFITLPIALDAALSYVEDLGGESL